MTDSINTAVRREGILSVSDAAKNIGQPRSRIYGWIRRKNGLQVQRHGRRIYITEAELEAFMRKQMKAIGPADQEAQLGNGEPLSAAEVVSTADNESANKQSTPVPSKNGTSGQRELRGRPRQLGGRGFFCVPEWRAV